ncbi:hypothetical protein Baya_7321 [Bagarius yarrelli]|uniref:Uncharacterized protein n=1 Tax=Bagarius yarrelli TaxID=175774 RepID=A0A556U1P5_BAGYA|nr:hypothetical protein Baya_7321 [Bagarius yarrelli]
MYLILESPSCVSTGYFDKAEQEKFCPFLIKLSSQSGVDVCLKEKLNTVLVALTRRGRSSDAHARTERFLYRWITAQKMPSSA